MSSDPNQTTQYSPDWTEEMEAISDKRPIFTVYDGNCYWSMPDGSNRCITGADAKRINDALKAVERANEQ